MTPHLTIPVCPVSLHLLDCSKSLSLHRHAQQATLTSDSMGRPPRKSVTTLPQDSDLQPQCPRYQNVVVLAHCCPLVCTQLHVAPTDLQLLGRSLTVAHEATQARPGLALCCSQSHLTASYAPALLLHGSDTGHMSVCML